MRINIPNQITLIRFALAAVFFVLLSLFSAERFESERWILKACFCLFLVAAISDVLDGLLARLMKQVTSFGRILDPVVDKVMVCGAFVFFASPHFWQDNVSISSVQPWMVIVILVRELLVSAIRSHSESVGQDFGASWVGKVKMFVQSLAVCVVLFQLAWLDPAGVPIRVAAVWLALGVTVLSILSYVRRAHSFLLSQSALVGGSTDTPSPTVTDQPATPAGSAGSASSARAHAEMGDHA